MANEMINRPAEGCYSFDVRGGSLCDPLGRTWHPNNPDYDPGPPPPPKPQKEKKEQKKKGIPAEGSANKVEVSRQHRQPQRARGRHYHQHGERSNCKPSWLGEVGTGPSSGQMNGLQRPSGGLNGGRGHGNAGPGSIRQCYGRGRGDGWVGTFNKYVRGVLRTLRHL